MTPLFFTAHEGMAQRSQPKRRPMAQKGMTLVELMVGITIGLLVVAIATTALMVSRGVSGTVSDASGIQQQASYAIRVIGAQMRQAGSLFLNPNPTGVAAAATESFLQPVAFETDSRDPTNVGLPFNPALNTINSTSTSITAGYRRYKDQMHGSVDEQSLMRNCLGGPIDTSTDQIVQSAFTFDAAKSELQCSGNNAPAQPIIKNVAEFQLRYLVQDNAIKGAPVIRNTTTVPTNWSQVQAVEVCMVLYGSERIDMPAGSNYVGCSDTPVDMSTLTGDRARRMHMRFKNVFQMRSQGLVGSAIPAI